METATPYQKSSEVLNTPVPPAPVPPAPPPSGFDIWYQVFLWCLCSSIFLYALASAIAFFTLRKHKFGR